MHTNYTLMKRDQDEPAMKVTLSALARWWIVVMLTSGGVLVPRLACAADLITGAIPLNPTAASVAAQDKLIQQLKAAGVHVIRVALTPDYVRIDFAKRANAQGIKIEALIEPQVPKGASSAPDPSGGAPRTWGGLVLDAIDPLVVGRTLLIMVPLPAAACPAAPCG